MVNRVDITRPSNLSIWMEKAEAAAKRSHDAQTKVGSVLVHNESKSDLMTGYNGFVRGANDLLLPNLRPEKYEYIIHSEQNLLMNCVRHGVSSNNCSLICTHSPCVMCMRLLYQAGITDVIIKTKYSDYEKIKKMNDLCITEEMTPEGFFHLKYAVKK